MVTPKSQGTRDIPLKFARSVTEVVNKAWEDGSFLGRVTPITRDLLRFWFSDAFCETRRFNFHQGQRQAILNTIYLHEVLKAGNVLEMYHSVYPELLQEMDLLDLKRDKYSHPKYAIKMATGTGKTWVMHALLLWQYLNAQHEQAEPAGCYSKHFLLVAPGLIVYERLLDAYLGKQQDDGTRDFESSDFRIFENLFIPPAYREEVFGFLQSAVARKEEIGKKVTGEGLIAITNWHLLSGEENESEDAESPLENPSRTVQGLRPIAPGTTAGHALDTLDNQFLRGREIEFLAALPDLVVFNDEAHHIHEVKKAGDVFEVEWQKSLLRIAESKRQHFIQIDFSATPYNVTGSGQKRTRHFFPHIIVDFDLRSAIWRGLVKTIVLDKRKEIASLPLNFKVERDGRKILGLSDGQKVMLRAGLKKLRLLEHEFVALTQDQEGMSSKHPKMLVICEDTKVAPYVSEFLRASEGLAEEDVTEIHSDRKGNIPAREWEQTKQKLFQIDAHEKPKVIVSVLMLREGFDVNNICVIVPLRSSSSMILLEQTIGRGLRLMWREQEFAEVKAENRVKLLERKQEPANYLDILSIIEHPAFIEFYEDLIRNGMVGSSTQEPDSRSSVLGDIIKVGLRENYQPYDFFIPLIAQEREESLTPKDLSLDGMEPFPVPLVDLQKLVPKEGDVFFSEEVTVKTRFGEYAVTADIFTAKSYNEFIAKLVNGVSSLLIPVGKRKTSKRFPLMQINTASIARFTDEYIRQRLFNQPFDPLEGTNWRVLLLSESRIVQHILKNVSKAIYELQNSIEVTEATVLKRHFSEVKELRMREDFSLEVSKCIYERVGYPSNRGGFERAFIEFVDKDAQVQAFLKINETQHDFAHITYIREDGLLSHYYPDFLVRIGDRVYVVETKAQKNVNHPNVRQKRLATVDWVDKVNALKPEDRMDCTWSYVLLGETTFYEMQDKEASTQEILKYAEMTRAKVEGTLGDYL